MPNDQRPFIVMPDETCCRNCPPERVCAWACEQGMSWTDIIIGTALELLPGETEADTTQFVTDALFWRYNTG